MSWLIVRRCGIDWALPDALNPKVEADGRSLALTLGAKRLAIDEVVTVVGELRVRPLGLLGSLWRETAVGLSLFDSRPVVVVDPQRPPGALAGAATDAQQHGEEGGTWNE